MGRDTLNFEDDGEAWRYLKERGYTMNKGVIAFRPEKRGNMPPDEAAAIDYLFDEWDWSYE